VRLAIPARDADRLPLESASWAGLLSALAAKVAMPPDLAPVLRLSYLRCRFTDNHGARVTLDSDIRVEGTSATRLGLPPVPGPLPAAVFEYKSRFSDLPPHLAAVVRFGGRRGSYSKYLACYQHVARPSL
jgi:hypothetical protein